MEDDGHLWGELLILILLILANGVCSMTEIAIVGSRKTKLKEMADNGDKGALRAIEIANNPSQLFATIQIGITAIGIITGMFSGASLAVPLAAELREISFAAPYASGLAMLIVMSIVTYLSLIIGELVPKWLAINAPEQISAAIARPMTAFALICKPIVVFSTWSTNVVIHMLGVKVKGERPVSEDEIRVLLRQGARLGTFDKEEPELVDNIFQLNDLTAEACMTARPQLVWIDMDDTEEEIWKTLRGTMHFRLPVGRGSLDNFLGLADLREILMDQHLSEGKKSIQDSIEAVTRPPLYIPDTLTLVKLIQAFRQKGAHEAIVLDEYGALEGLITLHDVLEEIVGAMPGNERDLREERNRCLRRSDNTWLVEALISIEDFKTFFHITQELPGEDGDYYKTLGGFIIYLFGYIPKETEIISYDSFTFEIMDCDHQRIDKVLVTVGAHDTTPGKEQEKK